MGANIHIPSIHVKIKFNCSNVSATYTMRFELTPASEQFMNIYLPPRKLREGNVLTGVCQSFSPQGRGGYVSSDDH